LNDILTNWQSNFNIEQGPLYSFGYVFGFDDGSARIHIALHHLVVDSVSCRIIADALYDIYHDIELGEASNNYGDWSKAIACYPELYPKEKDFWRNSLIGQMNLRKLNTMHIVEQSTCRITKSLDLDRTNQLLNFVAKSNKFEINDILLSALAYALRNITNRNCNYILLEGHGREELFSNIDTTNMIGWYTSIFPVRLEVQASLEETLLYTMQSLKQIPNKGLGFGSFTDFSTTELPEISFNYLGQSYDQVLSANAQAWQLSNEFNGDSINQANEFTSMIAVNCIIFNKKLNIDIHCKLDIETTNKFLSQFVDALEFIYSQPYNIYKNILAICEFKEYDPYIVLETNIKNSIPEMNLFMLPPAESGAEAYINNLAQKLCNMNLIIFNNFYNHIFKFCGISMASALSYKNLASQYICYMRSIQSCGPYNIFGWSFGAVLSFEIARQLQESGDVVDNLFLIDPFFDYASVLYETGSTLTDINLINYNYNSKCDMKYWRAKIILYKALRYDNGDLILKHYALNCPYNNIDTMLDTKSLINDGKLSIIPMNNTHGDWIASSVQLESISNHIKNMIQPDSRSF